MSNQHRHPEGTPAGGRFASSRHAEADVDLGVGDKWAAAADAAVLDETDQAGNRWTLCAGCDDMIGAKRGSNVWAASNGSATCSGKDADSGVHRPDGRVAITDLRIAEEKVSAIRSEIAEAAATDPDESRIGSVKLHDAVQRLAAAEVEVDLWDRVQTRLDANPSEFPTVNSAIASVYDQVLEEIIDSGAHDTASGRSGDIRRVRFDAERTWLSRRRLQGQVSTPQRSAPTDFEVPPIPQVDDHGDDHDGTTTSSTPRSPEPVPDLAAALMESIERAKRDRQAKASPNADGS